MKECLNLSFLVLSGCRIQGGGRAIVCPAVAEGGGAGDAQALSCPEATPAKALSPVVQPWQS